MQNDITTMLILCYFGIDTMIFQHVHINELKIYKN